MKKQSVVAFMLLSSSATDCEAGHTGTFSLMQRHSVPAWNSNLIRLGLVLALMLACVSSQAAPVNFYFFGDSLTDNGSPVVPPPPSASPYSGNSFSNGPVWAETVGNAFGVPITWGINNFAVGGAVSEDLNAAITPGQGLAGGGLGQTAHFLSTTGGVANPNALYNIWMGANDFLGFLTGPPGGDPVSLINGILTSTGTAIGTLNAAGAEKFLLMNFPDYSVSALVLDADKPAVSALFQNYNLALSAFASTLEGELGIEIWTYDVSGLLTANNGSWLDSTGALGIAPGESALTCLSVVACALAAPGGDTSQYFLFDDLHPTKEVHALIGNGVAAHIPIPTILPLTAIALAGLSFQRRKAA